MAAVDILMATYNGDRFVREQVESVQAQTFEDWRLLVSDDCSSDGTLGVVRGMVGADSRIQIVSEGVRFGSAKANFMGLLACSDAPYAMFCDQDDVWLPRKVGRTLGAMRELESAYGAGRPLLVFTDMKVVDEDLEPIAESFERYQGLDPARLEFRQVLAQAVGAGCTFLMNRSLVKLAQRCGDVDRMVMHDWWVAAVAAAFGRIGYLDEPTSLYRQHADNSVGARRYSALGWAGRLGDMVESQRRVSAQAGFLVLTYGPLMDETRLRCARSCASVCEGGAFAGLASLVRSGAWKAGSRKFGQIAAALAGGGSIVAVVVTYNPDLDRLRENVSAVMQQVSAVMVVDNGSRNAREVENLALGLGCLCSLGGKNVGLSRTLNRACRAAWVLSARYVLTLDQDSIAGPGMVAGLRAQMAEGVGLVSPQVVDRNKREGFVSGPPNVAIRRAITSGALVSLDAWFSVGGYDERLFVDWVDYEFSARLRSCGYCLVRNNEVMLLHEMGRREYAFSIPTLKGLRRLYRSNHSLVRQRDKARSWAIVKNTYGWCKVGRQERVYIGAIALRDFVLERGRISMAKAFLSGAREGRAVAAAIGRSGR